MNPLPCAVAALAFLGIVGLPGAVHETHESDEPEQIFAELVAAEDWRDRTAARDRLIAIGEPALDVALDGSEKDAREEVRRACYEILFELVENERAMRAIINNGLPDESPTIRYMCAFHLGSARAYAAFRPLQNRLGQESEELPRLAIAKSLAELGEGDGLPLLYDAMGSDWYMPRYLAQLGFTAITGRSINEFDYDFAEGAFVSGGNEARHPRKPVEDAEQRARRYRTIANYCRWMRETRPEIYKHIDETW